MKSLIRIVQYDTHDLTVVFITVKKHSYTVSHERVHVTILIFARDLFSRIPREREIRENIRRENVYILLLCILYVYFPGHRQC